MKLARLVNAEASTSASAASTSSCPTFMCRMRIFKKTNSKNPGSVGIELISGMNIRVINCWTEPIEAGTKLVIGQTIQERWIPIAEEC